MGGTGKHAIAQMRVENVTGLTKIHAKIVASEYASVKVLCILIYHIWKLY